MSSRSSDSEDSDTPDIGIDEIDDDLLQLEKMRKSLQNNLKLRPIKSTGNLKQPKPQSIQPTELAALLPKEVLVIDARNGTAPTATLQNSVPLTLPSLVLRRSKLPSNPITSLTSLRPYVTTESGRTRLDDYTSTDLDVVVYDDGQPSATSSALLDLLPAFAHRLYHASFPIDPPPESLQSFISSQDDEDTGEGLYHLSTNHTYKPKHPFRVTQSASTAGSSLPALSGAHSSRMHSGLPSSIRSSARSGKPPPLSLGMDDNFSHFLPPTAEASGPSSPQASAGVTGFTRPKLPSRRPSAPALSVGAHSTFNDMEADITSSLPPPKRKLSSAASSERLPKLSLNTNTRPVLSLPTATQKTQAKSAVASVPPMRIGSPPMPALPSNPLSLNLSHSNFNTNAIKKKNSTPEFLTIPGGVGGPGKRPKSPGALKLTHSNHTAADAAVSSRSRDPSPLRPIVNGSSEPATPESNHWSLSPVSPDQVVAPVAPSGMNGGSGDGMTPYFTPPHTPLTPRVPSALPPMTPFYTPYLNGNGNGNYPELPPPLPKHSNGLDDYIESPASTTSEGGQVILSYNQHAYPGDNDREGGNSYNLPPSPTTAKPTGAIKSSFGATGFPSTPNHAENEPGGGSENAPPPFTISTILPGLLYLGPEPTTQGHLEELNGFGMKRIVNVAVECEDALGLAAVFGTAKEREAEMQAGGIGSKPGYWKIGLKDVVEEEGVGPMCKEVCRILDSSRLHNLPTYVHCRAGKSRSVTAVLAYLIHAHHWTLSQSYAYVAERRKGISPNIGFVSELMGWEEEELRGHRHIHAPDNAPPGMTRSKTTAAHSMLQKSAPVDGVHLRRLQQDDDDEDEEELPLGGIPAPPAPPTVPDSGASSPVNGTKNPLHARIARPHLRDSLPPHLSASSASALSALDLDSASRSTMDPAQEMEVKDSTGRYRHVRRAPVNENTLQPMRRVSKAGLESGRWDWDDDS